MLPYYAPLAEKVEKKIQYNNLLKINFSSAAAYANNYATNPNKGNYDYFRTGDCANFASQILEASGVSQDVYDNEAKGWWHKKVKNLI